MVRIEQRTILDEPILDDIRGLIAQATAIEGHSPVGEHKAAHLAVGARGWVGILAYDEGGDGAVEGRDERRLVGYAHTRWNPSGDRPRLAVEVVVHPDLYGSDVAQRLLEQTRALLTGAGGGLLWLWVHRVEDPQTTLAARLGFRVQRELAYMVRTLDERPEVPPVPEGVTLRAYRPDVDDRAVLAVNNAAFAGHPENGGWSLEELRRRRGYDWFEAEGLITAWRGEELLGFHWTKRHAHEADAAPAHAPEGEVYVLAVSPRAQGMGLGRVLLLAGLAHLHDRDCRTASLYVDRSNAAAVRLYEREGFALRYLDVCYEDRVPAAEVGDLARPGY